MLKGMKRFVVSVVCAQAVMLGACGGPVVDSQLEQTGTEESAILLCDGYNEYNREYYSDATYTRWVGSETCLCNGTLNRTGLRTRYYLDATYACY